MLNNRTLTLAINNYLEMMINKGASDIFFSVGSPVAFKVEGILQYQNEEVLSQEDVNSMISSLTTDVQAKIFDEKWELNFALHFKELGRFRVNLFKQKGDNSIAIRSIKTKIPKVEELNLPTYLKTIALERSGLVIVVGATGSGKTTTLASLIDYRNTTTKSHIISIEDPIEFVHSHKKSIVEQREIGIDTKSYDDALKNALRESPDVVLIGEMRDIGTIEYAISLAETGHLCFTTLHANNSVQAIERIANYYQGSAKSRILQDLSMVLKAIICQRLVIGKDGKRLPATELMMNTPYVSDLIAKGKLYELNKAIEETKREYAHTFDQSLFDLYVAGKIDKKEAVSHADSQNNLSLRIRMET